jgi:hypothetical protein
MEVKKSPKVAENKKCVKCDYTCSKLSDYKKHLLTRKHQNGSKWKYLEVTENNSCFACDICHKKYMTHSGLWKHSQKCTIKKVADNEVVQMFIKENTDIKNVILELVKNNSELQKQMLDICKMPNNINNTIISNNHNNTFNLQFFLNEQCKDAMNLMDFVDSFKLQFSDLEQVGEMGYIEGISNIIMKKLNEMDVYKRPIHCSDAKREIMYVKDDNVWEKEKPSCDKLRKAIKYISKKNSDLIPAWNTKNPLANNFASHVNDQYLQIIKQSMGGSGEIEDSETKIIKKLAKMVLIDK